MGKFVIKSTDKGVHFVLKASNGEIIATSQVYKSMESCKKAVEGVKKNAPTQRSSWKRLKREACDLIG